MRDLLPSSEEERRVTLNSNLVRYQHNYQYDCNHLNNTPMKKLKQYNKPSEQDLDQSAFSIYYKHQSDPQYPLLLANVIHRTQSQLEESRAMKMLGDWVTEYQQMGEIIKYKYVPYLSKIQKILLGKFQKKAAIQYCLARFFVCFYNAWKEFTSLLAEKLRGSDPYALSFLWYTAHNLVTDMQLSKLQPFIEFITSNYEEPLRMFDPQLYNDAKKILEIVYLINLHGCRENFADHANGWALKMRLFQDAGQQSEQIELNMRILRNHSLLMLEEKSRLYWLNKVSMFFQFLEKNLPGMKEEGSLNGEIIRLFQWLIELPQVKSLLLKWQSRYMRSLVNVIRPNPNQPKFIFNNPRYFTISNLISTIVNSLYELYFKNDEIKTQNQVKETLQKFTNHAFSILNDEKTYAFLQCYSQKEIILQPELITNILKLLNSNHIRRTLSAKVILILAKIIDATINNCTFTDQMITMCLRAFSESLVQKSTDPIISDLRAKVAQLFLHVMKLYTWQDNSKSEMVFLLCQEYQKNSKFTNPIVLELLSILVKKFGYAIHSLHKLQPLVIELHLKIVFDEINMHEFISLLLIIYFSTRWEKATSLIESVCSKNPSPLAPFYSFQAQTLIKSNSSSSKDQMEIVASILQNRQKWVDTRIHVNLILLQMYFLRLNSEQATKVLCEVDKKILSLITQFYEEGNYRLLCLLAAKTLPAAGGAVNLQKLQSYLWIRSMSFEILARSFYKSTSINVCYFFSNVVLRADHQAMTVRWLSQDQFLDYLYQGLNDFLSKEKKITLEIASTVLVFKLFKVDPSILPSDSRIPDFTTIAKNVGWWDDAGNTFAFELLQEGEKGSSWLLPEFQRFYEEAVVEFFKEYLKNYKEKKARQIRELESLSMNDDDIN